MKAGSSPIFLLRTLQCCPSLSWRRRTRSLTVQTYVLRTSLSSTKIYQNSLNTYPLMYLALLLDPRFGPFKHQTGLSSIANPLNSLEQVHWSVYRSRLLDAVAKTCLYLEPWCCDLRCSNKQTRLGASDPESAFSSQWFMQFCIATGSTCREPPGINPENFQEILVANKLAHISSDALDTDPRTRPHSATFTFNLASCTYEVPVSQITASLLVKNLKTRSRIPVSTHTPATSAAIAVPTSTSTVIFADCHPSVPVDPFYHRRRFHFYSCLGNCHSRSLSPASMIQNYLHLSTTSFLCPSVFMLAKRSACSIVFPVDVFHEVHQSSK